MKTSELTGAALDWAVAKCEGYNPKWDEVKEDFMFSPHVYLCWLSEFKPTIHWAQGGPIIEREKLCVGYRHQSDPAYCQMNDLATNCWARTTSGGYLSYGPTPLIAAMRCLAKSRLGDEAEIPEDLLL